MRKCRGHLLQPLSFCFCLWHSLFSCHPPAPIYYISIPIPARTLLCRHRHRLVFSLGVKSNLKSLCSHSDAGAHSAAYATHRSLGFSFLILFASHWRNIAQLPVSSFQLPPETPKPPPSLLDAEQFCPPAATRTAPSTFAETLRNLN